jgi:hypothetical protein
MALTGDAFYFFYTASSYLAAQPDPDASLGGYRSKTRPETESAVTSAGSTAIFTDTAQIDDAPASPDYRTPLVNSGNYTSSGDLVHWYRLAVDDTDMGKDYATAGTPRDLDQFNLDSSDLSSEQPGMMDQQRKSVDFDGASNETIKIWSSPATFGIADEWSISAWVRPDDTSAGTYRFFRMSQTAASQGLNEIAFWRDGTTLEVQIADNTTIADRKHYQYNSFFALDTWVHVMVTWDGTNLLVYKNGSVVSVDTTTEDDSVTQSDGSRYFLISGRRWNFADPQDEWEGQIHSVCIWDVELGSSAISDLSGFGDGVGAAGGPLDHVGKWFVFVTGNNAIDARKCIYHDNTTGVMGFAPVWGTAPAVGEIYRISGPGHLFDDVTAAQCAAGHIDHRCLFLYNGTGVTLTDIRLYLLPLDDNGVELEVVAGNLQKGTNPVGSIAVDTDEPDLDDNLGADAFTSSIPQRFKQLPNYAAAINTPDPGTFDLVNLGSLPLWLRRTVPALHKRVDSSAWLLVAEETGGTKTAMVITHDVLGFTASFTGELDRIPRTFGGGRFTATVVDATIGLPIEDESVTIVISSGPGTLNSESQPLDTDVNGEAFAIYISPEDDAQAGNSVTITATLGGDS